MYKIAIFSLPPLETFAIQSLIDEIGNCYRTDVYEGNFDSLCRLDKYDSLLVSPEFIVDNLDALLPLRNKIMVVQSKYDSLKGKFWYLNTSKNLSIIKKTLEEFINREKESLTVGLTQREKEVLTELAAGKSQKEIADILSISTNTVITHRKNISAKLGIKSISGLSLYAMMNGLIKS